MSGCISTASGSLGIPNTHDGLEEQIYSHNYGISLIEDSNSENVAYALVDFQKTYHLKPYKPNSNVDSFTGNDGIEYETRITGSLLISSSGNWQRWSHLSGSNRRPDDYKSTALPAELRWLIHNFLD